jgi:hypothetical protein
MLGYVSYSYFDFPSKSLRVTSQTQDFLWQLVGTTSHSLLRLRVGAL